MQQADLSRFGVLKSALSFAITPLSRPKTFFPEEAADEAGLTSTINGACEFLRAAKSDNQSLMNDFVWFLYISSDYDQHLAIL